MEAIHWPGSRHFPSHVGDRGEQWGERAISVTLLILGTWLLDQGSDFPRLSVMSAYNPKGL